MGTTVEKLQYTANAVNSIKTAIIAKGISVSNTTPLGDYATKISSISTGMKVYSRYCEKSAGTWSGVTLSDSSWVNLADSTTNWTIWTYQLDTTIDISKVKYINASFIEPTNWIKIRPGTDDSVAVHLPALYIAGNIDVGVGSEYAQKGGIYRDTTNNCLVSTLKVDNNVGTNTNDYSGTMSFKVYSNKVEFVFNYTKRSPCRIKSTTPKFAFDIVYS